LRSLS